MFKVELTERDRSQFWKKGYWISPKLIDDAQIERLRQAHERMWRGDYDGDGYPLHGGFHMHPDPMKIRKLDNAWWINDEVKSAVTDSVLGEIAAYLLQAEEIRLWHDQVIYKPGAGENETNAGNVGWHQDYGYWQCSSTTNMITAWIALQDTDLSNGGMMSINGSHNWGVVEDSNMFFEQDLGNLRSKFSAGGADWQEEPCILKAGQASFHHSLTFHGSGPNRTDKPRLSIVAHLMPGDTAYRSGVQYHPNVMLLGPRAKDGQRFDNDYFPLLYAR